MPFRARKKITLIPGILDLNLSGSASRGKGATGGHSFTWRLGRRVSYNTRDGRTRVNTPGLGWWESSTRSQRNRRRMKQAAAPKAKAPAGSSRTKRDPDAAAWAAHFTDLRRAGGQEAAANSARAAGRCPDCGNVIPPGSWCTVCAKAAGERHTAAARGGPPRGGRPKPVIDTHSGSFTIAPDPADPKGGMYVWAGRPGARAIKGPFPDGVAANRWVDDNMLEVVRAARIETAPQNAHGQALPTDAGGWPTGAESWARSTPGQQNQEYRDRGLCGAPTKDGTNCLNRAGSCPHHRRVFA